MSAWLSSPMRQLSMLVKVAGSNPAKDVYHCLYFCLLPVSHSSARPIHIKSSMTFIKNNISKEIDIILIKWRPFISVQYSFNFSLVNFALIVFELTSSKENEYCLRRGYRKRLCGAHILSRKTKILISFKTPYTDFLLHDREIYLIYTIS